MIKKLGFSSEGYNYCTKHIGETIIMKSQHVDSCFNFACPGKKQAGSTKKKRKKSQRKDKNNPNKLESIKYEVYMCRAMNKACYIL